MPEHNEENRKKLAELVVNNMDFNDLIELATDKQIETYEEDKRIFEQDWDYYDSLSRWVKDGMMRTVTQTKLEIEDE